jgi:hypothetical protein
VHWTLPPDEVAQAPETDTPPELTLAPSSSSVASSPPIPPTPNASQDPPGSDANSLEGAICPPRVLAGVATSSVSPRASSRPEAKTTRLAGISLSSRATPAAEEPALPDAASSATSWRPRRNAVTAAASTVWAPAAV